jgi:hypothetical protein
MSNAPIASESFFQTWIKALTKPSENTYAEIAKSPSAKATTAYLWVFISSLVTFFFTFLLRSGSMLVRLNSNGRSGFGAIAILLICGTPIGAAIGTMFFALGVAIVQWIAKMFGGRGTFDQLAYVFAAIGVPYSLISSVLILLSAIPLVGLCFRAILGLAGFYIFILEIIAVKGVNQFGWGQAAASVLIPGIVVFITCFCVVFVGLAAMGPVLNQVFQQINQSLAP